MEHAPETDAVYRNVDNFLVRHPRFLSVYQNVRDLVALGRSSNEADCLLITGPPGTGKTTLRKLLKSEFRAVPDGRRFKIPGSPTELEADQIPLVVVEIPPQPRPLAVLKRLLKELGDPCWTRGRFEDATAKVDAFLAACGTVTIVFDEMQRLVDRAGIVTSEAVVEECKRIHGEHGVSLVFMGLGRIKYLFEQDTQLEDRWSEERRLEPFRCFYQAESNGSRFIERDEPQWAEWRGVLYALQQVTGLQSAEPLSDEDMARRLYFATGGVMRRLKILLKQAIRGMGAECDKRVGLPHLHQAYERQGRHAHNPFSLIFPAEMSLPQIEDDYQLRASPEKRRAQKRAASPSGRSLGARVADALRARR